MKILPIKFYQKLVFLAVMLGFSIPAMASNFSIFPTMFIVWLGCPAIIISILILFYLTKKKKFFKKPYAILLTIILIAINSPFMALNMFEMLEMLTKLTTGQNCLFNTTSQDCWLIGISYLIYSVLIVLFFKLIYHYGKLSKSTI